MLWWDPYRFNKKCTRTRYAGLVFLHPVGPAGHIVHSGAFGERNADTLFFVLGLDRYGFNKKHVGTHYAELVFLYPMAAACHIVHSRAFGP
jgi:hypothetical protein